jgi:hypothetical protein
VAVRIQAAHLLQEFFCHFYRKFVCIPDNKQRDVNMTRSWENSEAQPADRLLDRRRAIFQAGLIGGVHGDRQGRLNSVAIHDARQ